MSHSTLKVVAVVLNWNGARMTIRCVSHLLQQSHACTIIVVDNGSRPDDVAEIAAAHPGITILRLEENLGFAGGMNVGIAQAECLGAELTWLVNNDAFAHPECLERLVAYCASHPALGAATPRLLNPDGSEQNAGGTFEVGRGLFTFAKATEFPRPSDPGVWVSGTAPIVRSSTLRLCGGFDASYFAYWEDVDLSLRILASGRELHAVPDAVVEHHSGSTSGGATSPTVHYLDSRNEWFVIRPRVSGVGRLRAAAGYLARRLRRAGQLAAKDEQSAAYAVVAGMGHGLLGWAGPPSLKPNNRLWALLSQHPWKLASLAERMGSRR